MGRVSVFDDTHFSSFQLMELDLLINGAHQRGKKNEPKKMTKPGSTLEGRVQAANQGWFPFQALCHYGQLTVVSQMQNKIDNGAC